MTYQPKHQRQLNGTLTAGEDCGVRSTSMAIDFATRGATVPTVAALRTRMGVKTGPTNTSQQQKGAQSYDTPAETGKRKPVVFNRQSPAAWSEFVGPLTNGDKAVVLSLDYGIVNDKKPNVSGDRAFDGNHSIMFLGSRQTAQGTEVKAWDSLYDGRRQGIPKGPQWWPLWLVRDACAAFAGAGRATGGIVPYSPLLVPAAPPPGPMPPDPEPIELPDLPSREQQMEDALNEERTALVDFIVAAQERIAVLDRINPPNTRQALAVVSSGAAEETD